MRDEYDHVDSDHGPFAPSDMVPADFARRLEREREDLSEKIVQLTGELADAKRGVELMRQNAEHWKQEAERWRDSSAIHAKIADMRGQMNATYGAGRGWEAALDEMEDFLK